MTTRRIFSLSIVVLLLFTLLPLSSAAQKESISSQDHVLRVTDSRNVTVTLSEKPQRIVSLSPNITETLYALGLGDKVVGRTDYCDYPQEVFSVESVGDLMTPSVEKIISLEPDLVVVSNIGQQSTVEAIVQANIPIVYFDEDETMEGTYLLIRKVGAITGAAQEAEALILEMKESLSEAASLPMPAVKPTLYYVAGFGEWGDFTATGDTYMHDIISLAGAENIAADASNWSYQLELLIANDPDIIIVAPMWGSGVAQTIDEFVHHPSYSGLSAVKAGRVYGYEENLFERQGPRSALAVLELAKLINSVMR